MKRKSDTHLTVVMRLVESARPTVSAFLLALGLTGLGLSVASAADPAKPVTKADVAKGQALAGQVCAACHAVDGNSAIPSNPILAGQHADYLSKQLNNYRVKPGASEAERANAIMAGFAAMLSDDDIRNISAFYASQRIVPALPSDKSLVARGQEIYRAGIPAKGVPACAGCHSPNGAGIPAQYPRLSGQHADYTAATLTAFRSQERANSGQMMTIAAGMSDADIRAVAEYVAGLR